MLKVVENKYPIYLKITAESNDSINMTDFKIKKVEINETRQEIIVYTELTMVLKFVDDEFNKYLMKFIPKSRQMNIKCELMAYTQLNKDDLIFLLNHNNMEVKPKTKSTYNDIYKQKSLIVSIIDLDSNKIIDKFDQCYRIIDQKIDHIDYTMELTL